MGCSQCQLISLSTDHVVKLWDLRTNKCVQTLAEDDWPKGEEQPVAMAYDAGRKRLITAGKKPYLWEHKLVMRDASGHRGPCVKAMYNSAFFVVVSADESALLATRAPVRCVLNSTMPPTTACAGVLVVLFSKLRL